MSASEWRRVGSGALVSLLLATSGCRTWQTEPPAELEARERLPEAVQLVTPERTVLLEGSRIEGDTLIGFWEEDDGQWERIALPLDDPDVRVKVHQIHGPFTALYLGGMVGLLIYTSNY